MTIIYNDTCYATEDLAPLCEGLNYVRFKYLSAKERHRAIRKEVDWSASGNRHTFYLPRKDHCFYRSTLLHKLSAGGCIPAEKATAIAVEILCCRMSLQQAREQADSAPVQIHFLNMRSPEVKEARRQEQERMEDLEAIQGKRRLAKASADNVTRAEAYIRRAEQELPAQRESARKTKEELEQAEKAFENKWGGKP